MQETVCDFELRVVTRELGLARGVTSRERSGLARWFSYEYWLGQVSEVIVIEHVVKLRYTT